MLRGLKRSVKIECMQILHIKEACMQKLMRNALTKIGDVGLGKGERGIAREMLRIQEGKHTA
jgi:hypothetical protein